MSANSLCNYFGEQLDKKLDDMSLNDSRKDSNRFSCNTFSTEESSDEVFTLEELEDIIEDLISGKKSLSDVSSEIKHYSPEINKIPKIPRKPEEWECCGTGCSPCIWDTYDRDLEIHQRAVERLCTKISNDKEQ